MGADEPALRRAVTGQDRTGQDRTGPPLAGLEHATLPTGMERRDLSESRAVGYNRIVR